MKVFDLVNVRMGFGFRSKLEDDPKGNVRVIQPKDIENNGVLNMQHLCRVCMPVLKPNQQLIKGDVLLTSRGKFISAVYSKSMKKKCVASGSLLVLRVQENKAVLPEYLALYFNSKKGQRAFQRIMECSTIPSLNRSRLEEMKLMVPDLTTQKKLVALEQCKQRYAQLTCRKLELFNKITDRQLI